MTHFPHADALCALPQPYGYDSVPPGLFDKAMAEISRFHCQHTPGYEHWLNANGLCVNDLEHLTDWARLPPIYASYFKQRLLLSPTAENALELTSSGTSGQKSRMRYDERSMMAAQGMVAKIFEHYGWSTPDSPCNYLLFSHEPEAANQLGTAYTDQFLCRFAPANRVAYALRRTGKGHEFDVFGVIGALQSFAEEGLPVRIFGFPALLWHVLERMQQTAVQDLKLAQGSLVFLGAVGRSRPPRKSLAIRSTHASPGSWASRPTGAATATARSSTRCLTSNVNSIGSTYRSTRKSSCATPRTSVSSRWASQGCCRSSRPTSHPVRRTPW